MVPASAPSHAEADRALYEFYDEIPPPKLTGVPMDGRTLYEKTHFRLDMQGPTKTRKGNQSAIISKSNPSTRPRPAASNPSRPRLSSCRSLQWILRRSVGIHICSARTKPSYRPIADVNRLSLRRPTGNVSIAKSLGGESKVLITPSLETFKELFRIFDELGEEIKRIQWVGSFLLVLGDQEPLEYWQIRLPWAVNNIRIGYIWEEEVLDKMA